jgi:hypothetical protein
MEEQVKSEFIKTEEHLRADNAGKERLKKKTSAKKTRAQAKSTPHIGIIFWLGFFILICGLFMLNRDSIRKTLEKTQVWERLTGRTGTGQGLAAKVIPVFPVAPENRELALSPQTPEPRNRAAQSDPVRPDTPEASMRITPPNGQPGGAEAGKEDQAGNAGTQTAAAKPPAAEVPPKPAPPAKPEGIRDRALYYIQVDRGDGTILSIKVLRKIPVSDSPMLDALNALLQGPSEEEQGRGLISLIPGNVTILDARVLGKTAYINFNEDFQYNQYGAEGYIAQLRQVVWTATEFPTVEDVQFLVEGRRVDYLGESIWIGSPLSRELLQ